MFERFTDRARRSLQLANQEAQRFNHAEIGPTHILFGLLKEGSGVAAHVIKNMGIELRMVRDVIEKVVGAGQPVTNEVLMGRLPHTPDAKRVFERAVEEAKGLTHNYVGTEHLLLALLADTVTAELLAGVGITTDAVRQEVVTLVAPKPGDVNDTHTVLTALNALLGKAKREGELHTLRELLASALTLVDRILADQPFRMAHWQVVAPLIVPVPEEKEVSPGVTVRETS